MSAHRHVAGFTLIELIMVLVLIGILSVTIIPKIPLSDFNRQGFAQELLTVIRFAHKHAITSGCTIQVALTPGSYALSYTGSGPCAAGAVNDPTAGAAFAGTAPGGATITGSSFSFDAFGRASTGQSIAVAGETITVVAETGYAYRS